MLQLTTMPSTPPSISGGAALVNNPVIVVFMMLVATPSNVMPTHSQLTLLATTTSDSDPAINPDPTTTAARSERMRVTKGATSACNPSQ